MPNAGTEVITVNECLNTNDENDTFIGDCGITMQRIGRWIRPAVISTKNITEWALLPKRHAAAAIIFSKTRRSTLSIPT